MEVEVVVKIHGLLDEYDISLRKLSLMTDIGHSTLSKLGNQKRQNVHLNHIKKIAEALEIKDIRKIIDIEIIEEED